MISRRWLFALAIAAGCLAAVLYYAATQKADVVVVARDIDVPRAITREDVEVRTVSAELAPADAASRIEDVIGLVPRAPLLRGQLVLNRSLAAELADFRSGLVLSGELRAIAIPVTAVGAVGGAIVPGSRVDVLATPVLGRAPAGRATELLVSSAVVLDVRGESGVPFTPRDPRSAAMAGDRIGSVVLAVARSDEILFADRIATSTFVLALASAR